MPGGQTNRIALFISTIVVTATKGLKWNTWRVEMDATISQERPTATAALIEQKSRTIDWLTLLIVVLASAWIFSTPLRHAARIMPFVEDDFYYYLKVAQSVALGHDSTFNGLIRTNGYHPLYFAVLVGLSKVAHNLVDIFRGMWLIWVVASSATFLAARRLLTRSGSGPYLTNALALVALIPCIHIFCQGMEVTLTLPLGLWLLVAFRSRPASWSFRRSWWIGLLAALTVLSRLDAVFLVLLLLAATLVEPKLRWGLGFRQLSGFTLGIAPLLGAYFGFNHFYFHTWMPVSGAAKQIKSSPWPTLTALQSGGFNTAFLAVFLIVAGVLFWRTWHRLAPEDRPWLVAGAAFSYAQIGALSLVSDWPLWGWYYYTLRFDLLVGMVLMLVLVGPEWLRRQEVWWKVAGLGIALVLLLCTHFKQEPSMVPIYDVAVKLHSFEQAHPGVYAIGNGAGMPGYLMTNPVIQTEGLMMDPAFLEHIRRQDDLLGTLHQYGVRYYVTWETDQSHYRQRDDNQCLLAEEPDDAVGKVTLHMHGTLCGAPVASIAALGGTTYIFDLEQ
jgi:hypothetical protein